MSNISTYLEKIMSAVYGRDVRQSIHDAIQEIDSVADTAQDSATASAAAAERFARDAEDSASLAADSESSALKSAQASATSEANALKYSQTSTNKADAAAASASAALTSERNSKTSENNAAGYAETASTGAQTATEQSVLAGQASTSAEESKNIATVKAGEASASAEQADGYADMAKSYAVGTDGAVREGDALDNAKFYKEQAERIAEGLKGSLLPMGTITFAELPENPGDGYMYNISDEFVTTDLFKEGAGHTIPAGTNVYWTADGFWDCMAGSPVSSVNGQRGNVEITPENIGAVPTGGDTANNTVAFTSGDSTAPAGWTDVAALASGEKLSSLLNKISTMIKNARWLYKMLGTTDISAIGGGTVTGAIASQNETFTQQISDLNTDLSNLFKLVTAKGSSTTISPYSGSAVTCSYTAPSGYTLVGAVGFYSGDTHVLPLRVANNRIDLFNVSTTISYTVIPTITLLFIKSDFK